MRHFLHLPISIFLSYCSLKKNSKEEAQDVLNILKSYRRNIITKVIFSHFQKDYTNLRRSYRNSLVFSAPVENSGRVENVGNFNDVEIICLLEDEKFLRTDLED